MRCRMWSSCSEISSAKGVESLSTCSTFLMIRWSGIATNLLFLKAFILSSATGYAPLIPLDTETIYSSLKKTGKVIILQEDSMFGGIASDISALISEHCFEYLDAPIKRVAGLETPIPFAADLERAYLANDRFDAALKEIIAY